MSSAEMTRALRNIVSIGTVVEVVDGKALCVVDILGRKTPPLPMLQNANSFKRGYTPIRVGEQVVVLCSAGDSDFGVVIGSIFNQECKESEGAGQDKEVTTYSDGTVVSYDVAQKRLSIDAVGDIVCKAGGNIKIEAKGGVDIDGSVIDLN